MVLHPLAEVGIRVLVSVVVRRCQFVVDILSDGERRHRQQEDDEAE